MPVHLIQQEWISIWSTVWRNWFAWLCIYPRTLLDMHDPKPNSKQASQRLTNQVHLYNWGRLAFVTHLFNVETFCLWQEKCSIRNPKGYDQTINDKHPATDKLCWRSMSEMMKGSRCRKQERRRSRRMLHDFNIATWCIPSYISSHAIRNATLFASHVFPKDNSFCQIWMCLCYMQTNNTQKESLTSIWCDTSMSRTSGTQQSWRACWGRAPVHWLNCGSLQDWFQLTAQSPMALHQFSGHSSPVRIV